MIKRCIARVPDILENLDLESETGRGLVLQTVDFIRGYADRSTMPRRRISFSGISLRSWI